VVFRHEAPFDRSPLTRWRQRLGEEHITALLQESLSVAHRTGAIEIKDLERVAVDTTGRRRRSSSQRRPAHAPRHEKLVELAKREDVELRQSYLRLAKRAAIMVGALHACAPVQARPAPTRIPAHAVRPINSLGPSELKSKRVPSVR
jgi:IS5 family transposase